MPLKLKVNLFIIASTKLSSISLDLEKMFVPKKNPINLFVVMLSIERYFFLNDSNVGKRYKQQTEQHKIKQP